MKWEREYFRLAGFVLGCKMRANGGSVEGDSDPRCGSILNGHDRIGCLIGEVDYSAEMGLVLQEARKVAVRVPLANSAPVSVRS